MTAIIHILHDNFPFNKVDVSNEVTNLNQVPYSLHNAVKNIHSHSFRQKLISAILYIH